MAALEDFLFESNRLKTSKLKIDDVAALYEYYSDHESMRFRGSKPMTKVTDAEHMVKHTWAVEDDIIKCRLGIRLRSNDELIGTILLLLNNKQKVECEVGFSFGKKHWNKGYGKETIAMLEDWLPKRVGIKKLKAYCRKENIASNLIFEKVGFSLTEQNEYSQSNFYIKILD